MNGNAFYLGNDRILLKTHYGFPMYVNSCDVNVTPHLVMDGFWEKHITNLLQQITSNGQTCIDVGAHSGYYTLLMRQWVGDYGHVYSFEPNRTQAALIIDTLLLNAVYNKGVEFHNVALSNKETGIRMGFAKRHTGGSSALIADVSLDYLLDEVNVQVVKAVTLDSIVTKTVDVIKMDCEGAEISVLEGAARVLQNPNISIVMEWEPGFHRKTHSVEDLYSILTNRYGFKMFKVLPDSQLAPLNLETAQSEAPCDIFLSRQL